MKFSYFSVLMGILDRLYDKVVGELDVYHVIRLVVIVGGYLIFRARAQEWLKTRQLRAQLEEDKRKRQESLVERPQEGDDAAKAAQEAELEALNSADDVTLQDRNWGWGKQTRTRARKLQRKFEEAVEEAAVKAQRKADLAGGVDSDDELNEFLEE